VTYSPEIHSGKPRPISYAYAKCSCYSYYSIICCSVTVQCASAIRKLITEKCVNVKHARKISIGFCRRYYFVGYYRLDCVLCHNDVVVSSVGSLQLMANLVRRASDPMVA